MIYFKSRRSGERRAGFIGGVKAEGAVVHRRGGYFNLSYLYPWRSWRGGRGPCRGFECRCSDLVRDELAIYTEVCTKSPGRQDSYAKISDNAPPEELSGQGA